MPGASRAETDTAGGQILNGSGNVFINGKPAVTVGSKIKPHGSGPHAAATMVKGSSTVFVNGKPLVRAGDDASCGHKATGSDNVRAG